MGTQFGTGRTLLQLHCPARLQFDLRAHYSRPRQATFLSGAGPLVFSQHGSDAPVERQFVPQRLISGQNQLFPFSLSYTGVFEKDTTFLVLFDIDDDFTVAAANLRFFNVEREVILRPDIDADYTP